MSSHPDPIQEVALKLSRVLTWLEKQGACDPLLPQYINTDEKKEVPAYRWARASFAPTLMPIAELPSQSMDDLIGIDDQKSAMIANTQALLAGMPANNVLLSGARGCGKSSLMRALLNRFYDSGLRIIETDKRAIIDWHPLVQALKERLAHTPHNVPLAYILYCDDLSFDEGEHGYQTMKSLLDGAFDVLPPRVRIYASSNRRHLLPEYHEENLTYQHLGEEIHAGDVVEEKMSLSDRFGLCLRFHTVDQDTYLLICAHWLRTLATFHSPVQTMPIWDEVARSEALRFALDRGGRNGRIAEQFARGYINHHLAP